MSSPPPVTTPGSNVTPMWGGSWPGRPPASPPSCFSQLYGLNQCYDDIIMMKQILAKVVCDLATNDPTFQQCLAEGIAKSGSSVPLIGVTNGSAAQPGQVGEFIQNTVTGTYASGTTTNVVQAGILQPGDWALGGVFGVGGAVDSITGFLNPVPTGVSTSMSFYLGLAMAPPAGGAYTLLGLEAAQCLISTPTLLVFNVDIAATVGANYTMVFQAWRMR